MKGQTREEQFEEAEDLFTSDEDQDIIKTNKDVYHESSQIASLVDSEAGRILVKSLKDEISKSLSLLIETRKGRYISDIESNLNLLSKLINAKKTVTAIGSWLDSLE